MVFCSLCKYRRSLLSWDNSPGWRSSSYHKGLHVSHRSLQLPTEVFFCTWMIHPDSPLSESYPLFLSASGLSLITTCSPHPHRPWPLKADLCFLPLWSSFCTRRHSRCFNVTLGCCAECMLTTSAVAFQALKLRLKPMAQRCSREGGQEAVGPIPSTRTNKVGVPDRKAVVVSVPCAAGPLAAASSAGWATRVFACGGRHPERRI